MSKIYPICYVSNTCHTDGDLQIHKLSMQCGYTSPKLYKYGPNDQNTLVSRNRSLYSSNDSIVVCRSSAKREQEIKSMISHVHDEFVTTQQRELFGKKHENVDHRLIPIYLAATDASQIFLLGSFEVTLIKNSPTPDNTSLPRPKNVHSKDFFTWAKTIIGDNVICKAVENPKICGIISWYAKTFISSERYKYVEGQKSLPKKSTYHNGKALVPIELYFYDVNTKCWYRCNLWTPSYDIVWVPINLSEITPINLNHNIVVASDSHHVIPLSCIQIEVGKLLSSFDEEIEASNSDSNDGDGDYVESDDKDDQEDDNEIIMAESLSSVY